MENLTIIYYTSNRENPEFEQGIINNMLSVCGDIPIVSVSQKPMALGTNLCVGDVGASGFNMFRQVQLACALATTKYVVSVEADCLYPPDYFTYIPPRDDVCYRNTNLYVMGQWRKYFYHKQEGATHAQVVGRKYYLDTLTQLFEGAPMWSVEERNFPKERHAMEDVFNHVEYYSTTNSVVQIKTDRSMRHYTHSDRTPIYKLPYWGEGATFRKKYYI